MVSGCCSGGRRRCGGRCWRVTCAEATTHRTQTIRIHHAPLTERTTRALSTTTVHIRLQTVTHCVPARSGCRSFGGDFRRGGGRCRTGCLRRCWRIALPSLACIARTIAAQHANRARITTRALSTATVYVCLQTVLGAVVARHGCGGKGGCGGG